MEYLEKAKEEAKWAKIWTENYLLAVNKKQKNQEHTQSKALEYARAAFGFVNFTDFLENRAEYVTLVEETYSKVNAEIPELLRNQLNELPTKSVEEYKAEVRKKANLFMAMMSGIAGGQPLSPEDAQNIEKELKDLK